MHEEMMHQHRYIHIYMHIYIYTHTITLRVEGMYLNNEFRVQLPVDLVYRAML